MLRFEPLRSNVKRWPGACQSFVHFATRCITVLQMFVRFVISHYWRAFESLRKPSTARLLKGVLLFSGPWRWRIAIEVQYLAELRASSGVTRDFERLVICSAAHGRLRSFVLIAANVSLRLSNHQKFRASKAFLRAAAAGCAGHFEKARVVLEVICHGTSDSMIHLIDC